MKTELRPFKLKKILLDYKHVDPSDKLSDYYTFSGQGLMRLVQGDSLTQQGIFQCESPKYSKTVNSPLIYEVISNILSPEKKT